MERRSRPGHAHPRHSPRLRPPTPRLGKFSRQASLPRAAGRCEAQLGLRSPVSDVQAPTELTASPRTCNSSGLRRRHRPGVRVSMGPRAGVHSVSGPVRAGRPAHAVHPRLLPTCPGGANESPGRPPAGIWSGGGGAETGVLGRPYFCPRPLFHKGRRHVSSPVTESAVGRRKTCPFRGPATLEVQTSRRLVDRQRSWPISMGEPCGSRSP